MMDTMCKKLWHMFRIVYYMLRKELSRRKLTMDLQFILKRGKIAGKALVNLITFHHHHHHHHDLVKSSSSAAPSASSFSCRSMDPNLSIYNPVREVEFSCSSTPTYPSFHFHFNSLTRKRKNKAAAQYQYDTATAAAIAKAFEMLNSTTTTEEADGDGSEYCTPMLPSPSPVAPSFMLGLGLGLGKNPRTVRQLRITDSPFPIINEGELADGKVDKEAEEFIKRFYQQLKLQQYTPDYKVRPGGS